MRMRAGAWVALLVLAAPSTSHAVGYGRLPDRFQDEAVVTQLNHPVGMAFLPDGRLLVAEQRTARLRMIVSGRVATTDPLLTVDSVTTVGEEQGLLGIAVDPRWPAPAYVYVCYNALGGSMRVSRYEAVGDLSAPGSGSLSFDPGSRYDLVRDAPDELDAHNAGCLRFGPDHMLYVSLGDDQLGCTSQDSTTLRGVILRLQVSSLPAGPGVNSDEGALVPPDNPLYNHPNVHARLVWVMGLRNPFRFHIDPLDRSLFIADVGWNSWEEIDHATAGGQNFGWPYFEGPAPYVGQCPGIVPTSDVQAPIYAMYRLGTTSATMGAGVYRNPGCGPCGFPPEYEGDYFFSDYYQGFLRRLRGSGSSWSVAPPVAGQPSASDWGRGFEQVTDYTVGPDGALWYARKSTNYLNDTGEIHRIVYVWPAADVAGDETAPVRFSAPYPSPSRGLVNLEYALSVPGPIELSIWDAQGRYVRTLAKDFAAETGRHRLTWDGRADDGRAMTSGIYWARLTTGGRGFSERIALVR
jgi:glucose/arabinose dehydrogenase